MSPEEIKIREDERLRIRRIMASKPGQIAPEQAALLALTTNLRVGEATQILGRVAKVSSLVRSAM